MTIGERLKVLRKDMLNMTLEQFGTKVGVGKSAISDIERGRNNLSEQMYKAICREFNVSKTWLRTGEGEPFRELGREEQIADYFHDLEGLNEELKKRLVSALAAIGEDDWKIIRDLVQKIVRENEGKEKTADGNARLHADLDRQCAEKQNPKEGSAASTAI